MMLSSHPRWWSLLAILSVACAGQPEGSGASDETAASAEESTTQDSNETSTGSDDSTDTSDESTDTSDDSTTGDIDECVDADGDGYGEHCPLGPDCDDDNPAVWTDDACANCADADGDGWWVGCDAYPNIDGPDCDDTDACVWTEEGCAHCLDADDDGWWIGCDAYGSCGKPGPDCDDDNPEVTGEDIAELCDGVPQNCAGLIDPFPAADMCPAPGESDPSVGGWICDPPEPGVDGCKIGQCAPELHDVDLDPSNGCECEALPSSTAGTACNDAIDLGDLVDNSATVVVVSANVLPLDRDVWYRFRGVDQTDTTCDKNHIRIQFLDNPGDQYVFEVLRGSCNTPSSDAELIEYTWATDFRQTINTIWAGHCPCTAPAAPTNTNISVCSNFTAEYFVRVYRDPELEQPPTCEPYSLELSNGLYSWGSY
jgi:hypothetical protein